MKTFTLIFALLCSAFVANAQQYGLYNTKTMFDAFENPTQKAFVLDSSRQYLSNFLIPNFGSNFLSKGGSEDMVRTLIQEGKFNSKLIDQNNTSLNRISQISNVYLLTFRVFKHYKYQQEMGFSWQIKSDANLKFTNQTLKLIDDPSTFSNLNGNDALNNSGYAQTYHQFSFTYRENYNKQWAFGTKLSLLSGIQYNQLKINNSSVNLDAVADRLDININGLYRGTFVNADEVSKKDLIPTKNFGFSGTFGASYTSKKGVSIIANIKDLGFIRWGKNSYALDKTVMRSVNNVSGPGGGDSVQRAFSAIGREQAERKSFTSATNARADLFISKTYGPYRPTLIIAKDFYTRNGDVAWVNNLTAGNWSGAFTPTYNLNGYMLFGLQGMYKTPNFEVYLGTDNLFKTYYTTKGIIQGNGQIGTGYNGGSVYFGMSFKFGYTVEHPQNMSWMPGIKGQEQPSFFKKIGNLFKSKARKSQEAAKRP